MDDLSTPSATLESLKRKADIISEFCVILGVDIAIQKLRSYMANCVTVFILINPTILIQWGSGGCTGSKASNNNKTGCSCAEMTGYTYHTKQHINNTVKHS